MGVKSSQEQKAEELFSDLSSKKFNIQNPFIDYQLKYRPLDIGQLDTRTEDIYESAIRNLQDLLQEQRMEDIRAAAQRLQSQNIAGGAREALMQRIASQYAGQTQKGLSQLLTAKAQQKFENLLKANQSQMEFDKLFMNLLGQRANVDLANVQNLLNRYQLQGQLLQAFDDTTWVDDLLALGKTAGMLYLGMGRGGAI